MSRTALLSALVPLSALVACSEADEVALPEAADAEAAAVALVGGSAEEAERITEDGFDLWEVEVAMDNGGEVEVLLFVDDGKLFEIESDEGPFDYDGLDPLPGSLTYDEAREIARGEVAGEQVAWEVKYTEDGYFYEFYLLEVGDQLWEIKLWADSGEVFVVEAKDEID